MKVEYNGYTFVNNVKKYVFETNPVKIEVIKYAPLRNIIVLKLIYADNTTEVVSDINNCCSTKSELYGLFKYLELNGIPPTTDPLSLGESLNHTKIRLLKTFTPQKEILYKTEDKTYYKDEDILEWFNSKMPQLENNDQIKVDDDIISIDINSFGASLLLKITNKKEIVNTIHTLHQLKIINNDDNILKKFFKYTLIGYVNSFISQSTYKLEKIKQVNDEFTQFFTKNDSNNFLLMNNNLYLIQEQKQYSTIAPEYYKLYQQEWNKIVNTLNPIMAFGDNFYLQESTLPKNIKFNQDIGGFKKQGNTELIAGSPFPGIIYFVSKSPHQITGCLNGEIYGKIKNKHYKIWTHLTTIGLC